MLVVPLTLLVLTCAGCSGGSTPADGAGSTGPPRSEPTTGQESITVTSSDFTDGTPLDQSLSCDGPGLSPSLAWDGVPASAQSLALVVADPDAPGATYYHWLVVDIPATVDHVAAGHSPIGGIEETNSAGRLGYTPPCPPSGVHHYRFTIYALAKPTGLQIGTDVTTTIDAIATRAIASGTLVGTYSRG